MVDVTIVIIDRNLKKEEYHRLSSKVSTEKQMRIERFHHFEDAQRTLLGDMLSRMLIGEKCKLSNDNISFGINIFGKPYAKHIPDLYFNLSHSGNFVVCAIGNCRVGIDVEEIKPIDLTIAKHFFTQAETRYILKHSKKERLNVFFRIWTMKEAFVKCQGRGLSIPLNSFSVLDSDTDLAFDRIFENSTAVCYVCSAQKVRPDFTYLTIDDLMDRLRNFF